MRIIDFHSDTLHKLHYNNYEEGTAPNTLWRNSGHEDLERAIKAGYDAQFFACSLNYGESPVLESHYDDAIAMLEIAHAAEREHADKFAVAKSYEDLKRNQEAGKMSAFLTVEEGGIIEGDMERLEELYDRGVRLVTLTWNYENCIGYPNKIEQGLKPFGFEVVERMNDLGMIVDVSHLSDKGFYDVLGASKVPFIASHSNARALSKHARNMTDDMIKKLADNGGVMGLNFYGKFLDYSGNVSRISDMIEHAKHIINIGGSDIIALGSDFDGIDSELEIEDCSQMSKLCEGFEAAGFGYDLIEKIFHKNAEDFLSRLL